jgi:hypothetical protein
MVNSPIGEREVEVPSLSVAAAQGEKESPGGVIQSSLPKLTVVQRRPTRKLANTDRKVRLDDVEVPRVPFGNCGRLIFGKLAGMPLS